MLKKLLTLSLMLIVASSFVFAQQMQVIQPDGKVQNLKKGDDIREVLSISKIKGQDGTQYKNEVLSGVFDPTAVADTLAYFNDRGNITSNFGFFGQDVMVQWFQAPADIIIKAVGFSTSDDEGASAGISFRLIKANWTWEQLTTLPDIPAGLHIGLYPSEGDGYAGYDFFGEAATGAWIDSSDGRVGLPPWTDNADPALNTFDYDLWSDEGLGWPVTPVSSSSTAPVFQWVIMNDLLLEPELSKGEVFGVVAVHDGLLLDDERVGFWSGAPATSGIPGWKYYENGRFNPGVGNGWFARNFTWDFVVAVELTSDRAPKINSFDRLLTTVETGPLTVQANITDDNPSGGAAGVATAEIHYSLDSGKTFTPVAMTDLGNDTFEGQIPGQSAGTFITYKIVATDVEGLVTESSESTYSIFEAVNPELLVVFNGGSEGRANQLTPFYLQGLMGNKYDLWAGFGPIGDFISFYDALLVIHAEGGPSDNNQAVLTDYVAGGGKKLAVIGQEVLGFLNGYTDSTFVAGDFEYDVLGVMTSFNDVGAQTEASVVVPLAGTAYGDSLAMWVTDNSVDTLLFNPGGILGSDNWMDQFIPRDDIGSEVFINSLTNADGTERASGHNYTDGNGNDIFFMSVDPLTFSDPTGTLWAGNTTITPLGQFLRDKVVSIRLTDETVPVKFSLSQNYPNPFNPSTKIEFSVREAGLTSLKIYNVLGQEVATLVNKELKAGSYSVDYDASHLSSGMYIYSLKSGDQEFSKKMLLLK